MNAAVVNAVPDCAPPPATVTWPVAPLPRDTCDAHVHVFGPQARYPLAAGRNYTPHVCSLQDYRKVMAALGIERAVLVQPSVYGTDNSALLDALREGGPAFRGIAVPAGDATDEQLQEMHALGVRGIRLNLVNPQMLGIDDALALCARVQPMGWHLQVQLDLARGGGAALKALSDGTTLPVVVDHMGRLAPQARDNVLFDLLAAGRCWVKLSAPYRVSAAPPPHADLLGLVHALAQTNPGQLLWGSDWPHTEQPSVTPDAASLSAMLRSWFPSPQALTQICVDNPARLYDYPKEILP